VNPHQPSIQEAFDRHASVYDERFSSAVLGERIRSDFWQIADRAFASSRVILDLGAGTGEDAIHFAGNGIQVTAVDVSPGMIARLQSKAMAKGVSGRVRCVTGAMNEYLPDNLRFDGIVSNFGAINCLPDLTWLRATCNVALAPRSPVVLTTMGWLYPLETAVHLLKGQPGHAFRRLKHPCEVKIEGVAVRVYYHSLNQMRRMLGPQFRLERVEGLRAFLPVPGWEHLEPSIFQRALGPIDRFWCRWSVTATLADHFVSVWRYQP